MATLHLRAQCLECAELKLFDGAFGFLQAGCDFSNGALLDKALANDALLNRRQIVHEAEKAGVVVDGFQIRRGEVRMRVWILRVSRGRNFAGRTLVLIGKGVGGYAEKPSGEGSAAPFVVGKISEGFVKDFGGEVFGSGAVADAAGKEIVDALEMKLVERAKFRRVTLGGLHKRVLIQALRHGLLCRTSDGHHSSEHSNCREVEKVTEPSFLVMVARLAKR
jgi:hypothetical protein